MEENYLDGVKLNLIGRCLENYIVNLGKGKFVVWYSLVFVQPFLDTPHPPKFTVMRFFWHSKKTSIPHEIYIVKNNVCNFGFNDHGPETHFFHELEVWHANAMATIFM